MYPTKAWSGPTQRISFAIISIVLSGLALWLLGGCVDTTLYTTDERPFAASAVYGTWTVDWDQPPTIRVVPEKYARRFRTVEEYRLFVADRAKGLKLEIRPDHRAMLQYADGDKHGYYWRAVRNKRYDLWIQAPNVEASIGHGFKTLGANAALLTFQLEWDENVATRVPLKMTRETMPR